MQSRSESTLAIRPGLCGVGRINTMKTKTQESFSQLRGNLRAIEAYSANAPKEAGDAIAAVALSSIDRTHELEREHARAVHLLIRIKTVLKLHHDYKAESGLIEDIDRIVTGKYDSNPQLASL